MTIKMIAFDYDGVIPVEEAPLYLFDKLGRKAESDALANEFYSGLAGPKTEEERDAVPEIVWKKSFALYREYPVRKLKKILKDLKFIPGAKEVFNYCAENGIKTAIVSATIEPILRWNLQSHNIRPDTLLSSECTIRNGRFDRLLEVLSPMKKRSRLEGVLRKYKIKPSECLVVGDAMSEIHMFKLVGKENSVAFNYRQQLADYCKYLFFQQNDPKRDLRKIIDVVEEKNRM